MKYTFLWVSGLVCSLSATASGLRLLLVHSHSCHHCRDIMDHKAEIIMLLYARGFAPVTIDSVELSTPDQVQLLKDGINKGKYQPIKGSFGVPLLMFLDKNGNEISSNCRLVGAAPVVLYTNNIQEKARHCSL